MSSSRNDIREGHYSISYESPNDEFKHNSNNLETNQDGQIPEDNYMIVYFTFFLQGIALLLGWNVFTTTMVYFHVRFIGTPFVDNFENYFSISFMFPNLLFLGYAIYFQKSVGKYVWSNSRFAFFINNDFYDAFTAYLQNGTFAVVSQFSPIYMQAVMSGQGLAGVIVAVFEIVSAITLENKNTPTEAELSQMALACFLFSMFMSLLSLITYFILTRSSLYLHHFPPHEKPIIHPIDQTLSNHSLQSTFNRIQLLCFAMFVDFTVTLALYPSITASIKSTTSNQKKYLFQQDYLFIPLHFLIFNLCDWVDVGMYGKRIVPLLINNDWFYFLVLIMFGITNGYLASMCMMAGPQVFGVVKDLAGTLLSFFIVLGLVCGSLFSFPLRAISCGCDPFAVN
ncbi:15591_t:CDS:2 [Dentiscutata erythropus]|uniref:15591_t:CDS:1 n=1 Tax=Dentiscutata erythropus TaxID=1348616 RepID=A0A9N8ZT36_9GLOM|nr:15591_t:CDS:2 [Dentiscutata erythropus]